MDGVYQCNRNRRNLEIPDERTSTQKTEVDFIVRQKEELLWDGTFEGKQWRFEKVKIDNARPPHDGEYVGTIEVVVLRCHHANKQPITRNETSSDQSSNGNGKSVLNNFDGTSDPQRESKSKSQIEYRTQVFGLDGGWDDWGPAPPPLDEPKMGEIEMTSENAGIWNPVGESSKGANALEKTKRWSKRSDSREHFRSDFQRHRSPAESQRGRSGQPRGTTDQESAPQLNLRGGGPGSYSIASSEAMRNWNRGPPAQKEWAQGDATLRGKEGPPPAFDPWTANLPTGDLQGEAETKLQTQSGAWGTMNKSRNKPRSKKSKKSSTASRSPHRVPGAWGESNDQDYGKNDDSRAKDEQNGGNNGNEWGTSGNIGSGGDAWEGANHDGWNLGGDHAQERGDDWNNNSSWDAQNKYGKKDDDDWNPANGTFNGDKDDWLENENSDTKQNGGWGAPDGKDPERNDNLGSSTGNDVQQGDDWGGGIGQQTDDWGGDNTIQVTTGAKDPEVVKKPTGNEPANGENARSSFSFGNSRATGPRLVSKVGLQDKPASVKSKAASIKSNKNPFRFDWLKPSLEKASNASGSPVAIEKASIPGASAAPVISPKQAEVKTMAARIAPTFSISTPPKPKPYWSTWRDSNTIAAAEMEQARSPSPEEIEEPLYSIPAEVAQRNMMSHQVRPGRPAAYTHKRNKPKYMDTHENPYAVFLFKYRDKEIIENMLNTTISEPEADEKARLASLSKKELIDELVRTKTKLSVVESESSGQATFVKKLDEKLSRLETSKEDVPLVGDWVNATSPTNGQEGIGNAGAWRTRGTTRDTQNGNGRGRSGNGSGTSAANSRDKTGHGNNNHNADEKGGGSWGGDANGKNDWNDDNNNGNVEPSNEVEGNGNGWGAADHGNTGSGNERNDDNGWGWNDDGGGGGWNHDDNNGVAPSGGDWGNDNHDDDGGGTKAAGEWGDDHDQGGNNGWGNDDGGTGTGGWGGNDGRKDDEAGFESSWGANTGGGGW